MNEVWLVDVSNYIIRWGSKQFTTREHQASYPAKMARTMFGNVRDSIILVSCVLFKEYHRFDNNLGR